MSGLYAGIGSRETPPTVLAAMTEIGRVLYGYGWILRSGGAMGADSAFEARVPVEGKQIFLPNDHYPQANYMAALEMAEQHHPAWSRVNWYGRRAHTRNCFIMLGIELRHPVEFVLCWTPHASASGGTGQAIRVAKARHIPVYDMGAMPLLSTDSYVEEVLLTLEEHHNVGSLFTV